MKSVLFAAVCVLVGVGCGGGSGGGDDDQMPDAHVDPHGLMSCSMGSATMCENACNPKPADTGLGCSAMGGFQNRNSLSCITTFIDSEGKRGCCAPAENPAGGFEMISFFECV